MPGTLKEYMQLSLPDIESTIAALLPKDDAYPGTIHQAMRYSTLGGGKRLRAMLVLAATEMLGGDRQTALRAGAAIEMIHAYSLIHDDLPCMDDDDLRRGKPTNHKVYGEAVAVLAGDALLTQAFALLADLAAHGLESEQVVRVIREVADAAGSQGLIGGQVVDIESEGKPIGRETLDYIHSHKTGALFRVCLRVGGIISRASENELAALTKFAEEFGLAFQIVDDILDVVGDTTALGKAVGSDAKLNKATYPALFGIDKARQMAQECIERSKSCLSRFSDGGERLLQLASYVVSRSH